MTPFRIFRSDFVTYTIGYVLALGLSVAAFALAYFQLATPVQGFAIILALGLVQIIVHMRCFLHMSLRSGRADLMLILFSVLIIALMVGGTLIVLFDLRMRMM